jgi:hypothetical protein
MGPLEVDIHQADMGLARAFEGHQVPNQFGDKLGAATANECDFDHGLVERGVATSRYLVPLQDHFQGV